jgi:hypothetical protein
MVRLIPIALAVVSLSLHEAWATTATAELRAFFADATLILTDPETDGKHEERLAAIRAITSQFFDVREAAKLSLGPAWRDRSDAEREEFAHLYGDFLERAFIAWIAARAQIDGGPRVATSASPWGAVRPPCGQPCSAATAVICRSSIEWSSAVIAGPCATS